ncbi:MAG: hypothetical protein COV29_00530 [Candidatus Yanofskybacteria bacterium CG10_big_fil_rev_8_21_14_0_10_36_16]|uniref:Endolytic murein transglycosylase n=1 Tax=Candidatus Yanofskybacteria bacterium CG10_big_fil_rev_8_21_14_0_10_36_16 TaxID=1975096 RepID=A0A2J0Q8C6_9BACT|nr:MAG: hypothetical protein COV29_00530 [Candidatus Yanofskybacteria bacterium CG10_big_fil_rev_8_21_14_0_10_36_16]
MALVLFLIEAFLVFLPLSPGYHETQILKIEKGQTVRETASLLAEMGVIRSEMVFVIHALITGNEDNFKAGNYDVSSSMSTHRLVKIFSLGLSRSEDIVVNIPEGLNISEIDKRLADAGIIERGDLLHKNILDKEGYFFPDTYRFPPPELEKISAGDVVEKMQYNFNLRTREIFNGLSNEEIKRAVIIASMLEKEVRNYDDMRLVSGMIEKRMEIDKALELDATVAYGVCLDVWLSGEVCDVTKVNLVDNIPRDSRYNTYKRKGLPEGPISNPGLNSIKASLNPLGSDYLYYLNTRDTGETIFSRTYQEHVTARRKYLGL